MRSIDYNLIPHLSWEIRAIEHENPMWLFDDHQAPSSSTYLINQRPWQTTQWSHVNGTYTANTLPK